MRKLSDEQIRENNHYIYLFEIKHGFKFYPATYSEVSHASKNYSDKTADIISGLENFLLNTFVIDMGTNDHRKMHDMRYEFTKDEYDWHKSHNKSGINCWGTFVGVHLGVLNMLLKRNDLHVGQKLLNSSSYPKLSFDEKADYCRKIDRDIYEILAKLYEERK